MGHEGAEPGNGALKGHLTQLSFFPPQKEKREEREEGREEDRLVWKNKYKTLL